MALAAADHLFEMQFLDPRMRELGKMRSEREEKPISCFNKLVALWATGAHSTG